MNLLERVRQPSFGCPPISQNSSFGHAEQRRRLADIAAAEEPTLHHQGLTRLKASQFLQSCIERDQLLAASGGRHDRFVKRNDLDCIAAAAFVSSATARGFDQKLAHGAGGDALEMQARRRT